MTQNELALLMATGFFPWGRNAWIHEDDLGTVLEDDDALRQARQLSTERRS